MTCLRLIILLIGVGFLIYYNDLFPYEHFSQNDTLNSHIRHDCSTINNVLWYGNSLLWKDQQVNGYESIDMNDKNILILGDSLSRRFAVTLSLLISKQNSTIEIHDLDRDHFTHGSIILPNNIKYIWSPCFSDVVEIYNNLKPNTYDLIIVSDGDHITEKCNKSWKKSSDDLIGIGRNDSSIFFRSEPLPDFSKIGHKYEKMLIAIRSYFKTNWPHSRFIDSQIVMRGRDNDKTRIRGNSHQHFGPAGRLAIVQHFYKTYRCLLDLSND